MKIGQFELEVLQTIGRSGDEYVRAELLAKMMTAPEHKIDSCLKDLKARGLVLELDGVWAGTYELSESGRRYLSESGVL